VKRIASTTTRKTTPKRKPKPPAEAKKLGNRSRRKKAKKRRSWSWPARTVPLGRIHASSAHLIVVGQSLALTTGLTRSSCGTLRL
jgi:hypothetical protein